MYFAGTTSFGIFVSRAGDLYGRKWPATISALIGLPLQVALLFSKSALTTAVLVFFLGATDPGRGQVNFVMACELAPKKHRTKLGSLILFSDASTIMLLSLYFKYVSKDWVYYWYFSIG